MGRCREAGSGVVLYSLSPYSQQNTICINQLNFLNFIINMLNNLHDNQVQICKVELHVILMQFFFTARCPGEIKCCNLPFNLR